MSITRNVLVAFVGVLLVLSVAFVLPFLQYFLLAVLLTYVLMPLQRRLSSRTDGRVAAGFLVLLSAVVFVLPLVVVGRATLGQAAALVESVQSGDITLSEVETVIEQATGLDVEVASTLQSAASGIQLESVVGVFGAVSHILLGVGLTLFLLYYFLKDGDKFVAWLRRTLPLDANVIDELFREIDNIVAAVLLGHVLIAIIQGILAGLGLIFVGIPNATFWTMVMIVLSLLPIVGSFMVWGPAVIYLLATGQPIAAVGLFVYGSLIVGVSDDYLRPIVIDRYAAVNPSVIIIGVTGGLYVLGVMGIFFGPIIIGLLRPMVDTVADEFRVTNHTE